LLDSLLQEKYSMNSDMIKLVTGVTR